MDAVDDGHDTVITKSDLYHYLVSKSETGISAKSVDKLFVKLDTSGDGTISEDEFSGVIAKCCDMLRKEMAINERIFKTIPDTHVIPGSCRMNGLSGTKAFSMQVVKRREMKQLWDLFNDVNLDGDGAISLMEFKRHIARHKPTLSGMSVSIFYSLDKNRNGSVTFKEMLERFFPEATAVDIKVLMHMANPQATLPKAKPDMSMLEEVRSIFAIYDDDQSGTLDGEEFVHAMELTGYSEEESNAMFQEIDADGSGEVSYEEFEHWYVNNVRRQARVLEEADNPSDEDED